MHNAHTHTSNLILIEKDFHTHEYKKKNHENGLNFSTELCKIIIHWSELWTLKWWFTIQNILTLSTEHWTLNTSRFLVKYINWTTFYFSKWRAQCNFEFYENVKAKWVVNKMLYFCIVYLRTPKTEMNLMPYIIGITKEWKFDDVNKKKNKKNWDIA